MSIFNKFSGRKKTEKEDFEKATFYLRPEQRADLDEIKYLLMRERVKTNNSQLVRFAIDLLKKKSIKDVKQSIKLA